MPEQTHSCILRNGGFPKPAGTSAQNENYHKAIRESKLIATVSSVFHCKKNQKTQATSTKCTSHHYQKLLPFGTTYKAFFACFFHILKGHI